MSGTRKRHRGHAAGARSTKGWARVKPETDGERRSLKKRCGAAAFLDARRLKYPIVASADSGCVPDCRGLRAAKSRASRFNRGLAAKAHRIGRRVGCRWAKESFGVNR